MVGSILFVLAFSESADYFGNFFGNFLGNSLGILWEFFGNSFLLRVALLSVWEGIDVCGCVADERND